MKDLIGATIVEITEHPDDLTGGPFSFTRLKLKLADHVEINGESVAYFEVWRDEEGNGPGYLAYLGGDLSKEN